MFRSKFINLKEKDTEALSQFWLEDAFVCHKTIYRIKVDKNDKASLTPTVVMYSHDSQFQICTKAHAEMVSR